MTLGEQVFVSARLATVGRCPARLGYIELAFTTPEGPWKWCLSKPPECEPEKTGLVAVTLGRYGPQARFVTEDGDLAPALPSVEAVPVILAGADVVIARSLVVHGRLRGGRLR